MKRLFFHLSFILACLGIQLLQAPKIYAQDTKELSQAEAYSFALAVLSLASSAESGGYPGEGDVPPICIDDGNTDLCECDFACKTTADYNPKDGTIDAAEFAEGKKSGECASVDKDSLGCNESGCGKTPYPQCSDPEKSCGAEPAEACAGLKASCTISYTASVRKCVCKVSFPGGLSCDYEKTARTVSGTKLFDGEAKCACNTKANKVAMIEAANKRCLAATCNMTEGLKAEIAKANPSSDGCKAMGKNTQVDSVDFSPCVCSVN